MLGFVKNRRNAGKVADPTKDPSGFLTVVYILALGLIALLATASHFMITQMTEAQIETAEIVYIAGRQRGTAQQVALYVTDYVGNRTPENKALVENAYFSFKLGHDYLIRGYQEEKKGNIDMSPELHALYFSEPINLNRKAQGYIILVDMFLKLDEETPDSKFLTFETVLLNRATGELIQALDMAAQQYHKESLAKIMRLTAMQTAVFVFLLLTLFAEAAFIFRPLVRHVQEYSKQLLEMALKDALTGLDNRRSFMQLAEVELSKARRHGTSVCVILSDIDKFKAVNDTYGHAAGDDVLKQLSGVLTGTLRKEDIVGRIGGEEFAFVLPNTSVEQGVKIVEKLRHKIETTPCPIEYEKEENFMLKYTSSFGLVVLDNQHENIDDFLKRADVALYEAKETGRNKVVISSAT